ncbi:hypothetical protein SAMN06265222_10274 [Neorhodopirellula lusitana]|uniref:Transmembrane protein n=1 Tax=Neorhodopirellula lusitana TaxID=445327 RepID=A0ABY1PSZ2_9BACT|nr:hypothetical protein [Neorhodopirellula lusitana]SMP46151.1 hypothetical protein SAMN06265222_10274 [Neorhodopirellula lusitana]
MRLTLRTLLAYLDDMLEEEDTQILQAKIEESGLATELIARIRNSVDHRQIGVLSPDAIGPLENANVMSEYLDSTLAPEQIAEIERLCLESDISLAEAAACHQILTVVLGQPAQVNDALRQRIYDLPLSDALQAMERQNQPAPDVRAAKRANTSLATGQPVADTPQEDSFSSLDFPGSDASTESLGLDSLETGIPTAGGLPGMSGIDSQPTVVRPVGPDDSGVTNAPARLRQGADVGDGESQSEAQIVARTTRAMLERKGHYGGNIRPSRIAPWLVTLAMAGVVLYALGQIFAPLTKRNSRQVGAVALEEIDNGPTSIVVDSPDPETTSEAIGDEPVDSSDNETPSGETVAAASDLESPESSDASSEPTMPDAEMTEPGLTGTDPNDSANLAAESPSLPNDPASVPSSETMTPDTDSISEPGPTAGNATDMPETSTPAMTDVADDSEGSENSTAEPILPTDDVPGDVAADAPPADRTSVVAQLVSNESLVLALGPNGWNRLQTVNATNGDDENAPADTPPANKQPAIVSGQNIIAPALYRSVLTNPDGLEWTLAGPTQATLSLDSSGSVLTEVIDGRLLLASTQPAVTTMLQLGPRLLKIVMPDAQTVLAVELAHIRPSGIDPLQPNNRRAIYTVIAVQGQATIESQLTSADASAVNEGSATLETGTQWQGQGSQPLAITKVDMLPTWIDAGNEKDLKADSARSGLLSFIDDDSLEKSLREAMEFRRVEVAALAGETLLLLGRADVYFGKDGILSRPRQRLFWTEHFQMLRQQMASSATTAATIQNAIKRAELADSDGLFKLLVGYTQDELANGGDAKLVEYLDSASMPVRVLAIENLKAIVGSDLGYRADQENANTRRADIKKWEARLRRGDIRY